MATAKKPKAIPKSLAACADELYTTRQARLAQQKIVDELQARESQLREHIINNLPKSKATGIAGKVARASIEMKEVPQVSSWPDYYAALVAEYNLHKKKKDGLEDTAFTMLQKRIGEGVIKEKLEAGKKVPGITVLNTPTISLTKV